MSYTTYDFSESLNRVGIDPKTIAEVVAAWGGGDGQGTDSGPGWSTEGVTDWSGGFLFRLKDGHYGYVQGWCDYTGWGCQEGADVQYFTEQPVIGPHLKPQDFPTEPYNWDEAPADLNKWLANGAKDPWGVD